MNQTGNLFLMSIYKGFESFLMSSYGSMVKIYKFKCSKMSALLSKMIKFKDYLAKISLVFRFNSSRTLSFSSTFSWFMVSSMSGFSFTVIFEIF